MTSTQIAYFLAVVDYKTFTLAAEELYISQSSLSKQIKALEEELGCVLFIRENKENILTDAGKIFLDFARNFSIEHSSLSDQLNELSLHSSKKAITVGVLPVINEYNIGHDLALFHDLIASSNIYINLLESTQTKLLSMLHSRKVDAIIIRTDNIDLSNYQSIQIIEEPLVAVLPKKYAEFTNKTSLSLSDLCSLPLITFDTTSDLYQTTQKLFKAKGINPHFSYLYQRHEQILSMINASFGAAIMPKHLVNTKSYPNLQLIPIEGAPNTTTSIVALKDACLSKELKLLFQYFSNITAE